MDISSVDSFPVQSGGSLIIFQLFRCRNLSLNRMFSNIKRQAWGVISLGGICMPCVHSYIPYICMPPIHPYASHTPCTSVCSSYTICSPYVMGAWGASVCPICLGVFWGHQYICQEFWCLSTSICLSAHKSCQLLPIIVGCFFPGMPMDVCYASCCCSFVVFIMSQSSTTTAMTTTPPVTVVSSGILSLLSMVTIAPALMGLSATSGQYDVVLLTPRHSGGVVGLATVLQRLPFQSYASHHFVFDVFGVCSEVCFQVPCWMPYSLMGLNHWGLHHCNPLELTHGRHMPNLVMVIGPHKVCIEWLLPPLLGVGEPHATQSAVPNHPICMVGHTALGAWQSQLVPPPSLHGGEGSSSRSGSI